MLIIIYVVPPPNIICHPMDIRIENGSDVIFNCTSFSYGPVTYTWLKDGEVLSDDDAKIIISNTADDNDMFSTELMLSDVQLSDNGEYVCNATNHNNNIGGTSSSNAATLSVIGKQIIISTTLGCDY